MLHQLMRVRPEWTLTLQQESLVRHKDEDTSAAVVLLLCIEQNESCDAQHQVNIFLIPWELLLLLLLLSKQQLRLNVRE